MILYSQLQGQLVDINYTITLWRRSALYAAQTRTALMSGNYGTWTCSGLWTHQVIRPIAMHLQAKEHRGFATMGDVQWAMESIGE
jgi:hypothetical protein